MEDSRKQSLDRPHDIFDPETWRKNFPELNEVRGRMQAIGTSKSGWKLDPLKTKDIEEVRGLQTTIFHKMMEPLEQNFSLDHSNYVSFVEEFKKQGEQTKSVMDDVTALVEALQKINHQSMQKRLG